MGLFVVDTSIHRALFRGISLSLSIFLAGCGGAPAEETSGSSSNTPGISSSSQIVSSSSSSLSSVSSSVATSSSISTTSSSVPTSSASSSSTTSASSVSSSSSLSNSSRSSSSSLSSSSQVSSSQSLSSESSSSDSSSSISSDNSSTSSSESSSSAVSSSVASSSEASSSSQSSSSSGDSSIDCVSGSGTTLYVNGSYAGTESGTKAQPYRKIQSAVTAASANAAINVAAGTYTEAVQVMRKVVQLCGGWSTDFSVRNSRNFDTTIQGTSTSATVVALTRPGQSSLVGFRIKSGRWGVNVDSEGNARANSDMLIADNIIETNGSFSNGGGIALDGGYITIRSNLIQNNKGDWGSALNIDSVESLIEENTIQNNVGGGDHGGGMVLWGGNVTFRNNLVKNNEVGKSAGYGWGGGMITLGGPHYLSGNIWTENYSPLHGGALFVDEGSVVHMNNDIFYNNRCSKEGGDAIAVDGGSGVRSKLYATNITVADHNCPGLNAIMMEANSDLALKNSIIWNPVGTTDIFFQEDNNTVNVSYSNFRTVVGAGSYGNVLTQGPGNLSADPIFANPPARDYHLQSNTGRYNPALNFWQMDPSHSPAIDAGDPTSSYSLETSPNGGRINMGAYGNTPEASRSQ